MAVEQGLYAQVVIIRQKYLNNRKKRKRPRNINFKGNPQDQHAGFILIMSD